ncbi:hypothetical protein PHLCEN_2v5214 [Hermanssonia centrifuga]|uniref:Integrase catalytic domain-containing protein n=1 Tax=Hermanssonia centrifuga TaxID=98765 RepID=A0A2R6P8V9_9APHY|nr:hypothetical protein PHLCEN_2v5214 [Hermanssonia centrifuga]
MDLWGPSPVRAPGGFQYTFTILDEATGWLHEPKMRTKDKAFGRFVAWQSQCFTQNGIRIKMVHSDRGGEFLSKDFTNFIEKEGIVCRLTVHNTPEHNGMTERVHRTIFNTVQTLLAESGLPPFLWGEAHNHSPRSFLQFKTPFKARHGVRPNCTFLRPWGTHVLVKMDATSKLAACAKEGRYVGHDFMSNGVRVYWPERHSVTVERTVIYLTDDIVAGEPSPEELQNFNLPPVDDDNDDMPDLIPFDDPIDDRSPKLTPQSDQGPTETHNDNQTDESPPISPISKFNQLQPQRKKSPSAKVRTLTDGTGITGEEFDHANNFLSANIVYATSQVGNNPANMKEALARPDSQQWMLAMVEEITRLEARNSWEYVFPPTNANLISARFVYNLKGDEHGNPTRYHARLVTQGYKQVEGLD